MIEWHDRVPSCYVMYLTMARAVNVSVMSIGRKQIR